MTTIGINIEIRCVGRGTMRLGASMQFRKYTVELVSVDALTETVLSELLATRQEIGEYSAAYGKVEEASLVVTVGSNLRSLVYDLKPDGVMDLLLADYAPQRHLSKD